MAPNALSGKAVNYAFNEWVYLSRYTTNDILNISNASVENKIRPFCAGRKNWLFSDTVAGAESSAMYYSLMVTSRANGLEPFDYFNKMLENLPYVLRLLKITSNCCHYRIFLNPRDPLVGKNLKNRIFLFCQYWGSCTAYNETKGSFPIKRQSSIKTRLS